MLIARTSFAGAACFFFDETGRIWAPSHTQYVGRAASRDSPPVEASFYTKDRADRRGRLWVLAASQSSFNFPVARTRSLPNRSLQRLRLRILRWIASGNNWPWPRAEIKQRLRCRRGAASRLRRLSGLCQGQRKRHAEAILNRAYVRRRFLIRLSVSRSSRTKWHTSRLRCKLFVHRDRALESYSCSQIRLCVLPSKIGHYPNTVAPTNINRLGVGLNLRSILLQMKGGSLTLNLPSKILRCSLRIRKWLIAAFMSRFLSVLSILCPFMRSLVRPPCTIS